jgi:hypothetical protein
MACEHPLKIWACTATAHLAVGWVGDCEVKAFGGQNLASILDGQMENLTEQR